jgi:hypothetical protein
MVLKRVLLVILVFFNISCFLYLISPAPKIPDLPNSVKSTEPGDTIQIPNVAAYYTNQSRTQVINFYKANYSALWRIILNHPPEKSKQIFRDTMRSYYLEELVLPYKESLFVNGFEWQNDVFTKPEKRIKNKLLYQGQEFKAKITIRTFPSSIPRRLIAFYFTQTAIIGSIFLLTKHA